MHAIFSFTIDFNDLLKDFIQVKWNENLASI